MLWLRKWCYIIHELNVCQIKSGQFLKGCNIRGKLSRTPPNQNALTMPLQVIQLATSIKHGRLFFFVRMKRSFLLCTLLVLFSPFFCAFRENATYTNMHEAYKHNICLPTYQSTYMATYLLTFIYTHIKMYKYIRPK